MTGYWKHGFAIAWKAMKHMGLVAPSVRLNLAPYGPKIMLAGDASPNHPNVLLTIPGADNGQWPVTLRVMANHGAGYADVAEVPYMPVRQPGYSWPAPALLTLDLSGLPPGACALKLVAVNAHGETDGNVLNYTVT